MKNKYGSSVVNLMRLSSRYKRQAMWACVEGLVLGVIVAGVIMWVVK